MGSITVDNFAGGGGASTGIEAALGRPVAIAINHSRAAIAMHAANHPETRHYQEDIWTVDPREAAAGYDVRPTCAVCEASRSGPCPYHQEVRRG